MRTGQFYTAIFTFLVGLFFASATVLNAATPHLPTYDIRGDIDGDGFSPANILVNVYHQSDMSTPVKSDRTGWWGDYELRNLETGTYRVVPTSTVYGFTPPHRDVEIINSDVGGIDFDAYELPEVTGRVTLNGSGFAGVTVSINTNPVQTALTDGAGNYRFDNIPQGSYRITPARNGYSFSPQYRDITVNDGPVTGQNFAATVLSSDISGQVVYEEASGPVPGVTMILWSGTAVLTSTVTGSDGTYRFEDLDIGDYRIVPERFLHSFTPPEKLVEVSGGDIGEINFTAYSAHLYLPLVQRNSLWEPLPTPTPPPTATPENCRNEIEPNNLANADANGNFEAARCIRGAIPVGDINDFYRIDFPGGTFNASLTEVPAQTDYDLALYRVTEGQPVLVASSITVGSESEHITDEPVASGIYYLAVQRRSGNSPQQYRLIWTHTP